MSASAHPQPAGQPTLVAAEDEQLVRDCLAASPGAWDAFVNRFGGLFAYVADRTIVQRQMPLAAADRDDLLAEILLECLRNDAAVLRAFAGRSSLPTYLTVIARRVAVRTLVRSLETGRLDGGLPDAAGRIDEMARVADREEVESLLGRLEADEARLVRLHHLEARSYGEISRITGMPLGSIGPALSRARDKMRADPTSEAVDHAP